MIEIFFVTLMLVNGCAIGQSSDINNYTDFCPYVANGANDYIKCGDVCLRDNGRAECHCGNDTSVPNVSNLHCCIKADETCTTTQSTIAFCNQGMAMPMSRKCDNTKSELQCYNSYKHSKSIGGQSHYTCPDTCVSLTYEMCQGSQLVR